MRIFLASAFVVLITSGCVFGNKPSTSGGGVADAAAPVCDGKKDCNACIACAEQNPCATQFSACANNSVCIGIKNCSDFCGAANQACKQDCLTNNPDGVSDYEALLQ